MNAPEWVCSVICAGLDIDEVLADSRMKASKPKFSTLNVQFDSVATSNQEEQSLLNVNTNQINSVA
jgi:hypothetical protein